MAKKKSLFFCSECGSESSKWLGRCPQCGEWNTFVEEVVDKSGNSHTTYRKDKRETPQPIPLGDIQTEDVPRIETTVTEIDRVLGGGIVPGSLILLGGDPGIGKSTLIMQVSGYLSSQGKNVFYASGEESQVQLKLRADRLGIHSEHVTILADTHLDHVLEEISKKECSLLIVDSIQTMYTDSIEQAPGSVSQVKECTGKLLRFAKENNTSVVIIGHVTKEGTIAGPRMLEHMVDVVLYFEGDRSFQYRILRAIKNRFGSTFETGLFAMEDAGLVELVDPSSELLSERSDTDNGSAVMAYLEGIRPILLEVQSLVTPTPYGMPRRTAIGYDINRLHLLLAVLEKKGSLVVGNKDVYVNMTSGLKVTEPASDLSIAMAIVSSYKDQPIPKGVVIIGEVGLTGHIRRVPRIEQRIEEAARMGFKEFIIPQSNKNSLKEIKGSITVRGVQNIEEAIKAIF